MELQGGLRRRASTRSDESWLDHRRRQDVQAPAAPLLCRRQLEDVRRGALPAARARLRRGGARGRHLSRLAAQIRRRSRAITTRRRVLFHVHGAARRGPDRSRRPTTPYPFVPVEARTQDRRTVRQADRDRTETRSTCRSAILLDQKADGFADADQRVHAVQRVRRLSLPAERQGGRAGDLHRSHARRARQCDAADRRLCRPAGAPTPSGRRDRRRCMSNRDGMRGRPTPPDTVVVACGALSSALLLLRSANDAASGRARQRIGPGRTQLHAARDERS